MPPYYWQVCRGGHVPHGAVMAGHDKDGAPVYVGRAHHAGDLVPAKVVPNKGGAYVPHNGQEHFKTAFEVLCGGSPAWMYAKAGHVPPSGYHVGQTSTGERLFVGRVMHDGATAVGKIHPSHGVCYIPYGGREIGKSEYEVLITN
ncbi:uncharacterized protein LOC126428269 [Schistocerca serialis cubense]|uniref:uncharacterized protein LOC126428269 n=1 Tax=Schistocerca serialis cubense TaxID=2023355 RepID=UPI00214EB189|nr:uncharacterized protein LOC126428269 [Schistocerca serialis cubense]